MGRLKVKDSSAPADGHKWWKICTKCNDFQPLEKFTFIKHRKRMVSGEMKFYHRRRTVCDGCYNEKSGEYRLTHREKKLLKSLNPDLHQYLNV